MEIMILTKNYGKGFTGATTSTFNLIDKWTQHGVNITVVTMNIVGPQNNNINIIKLDKLSSLVHFISKNNNKMWYSDDHFGVFLALNKCHYIHTYHGNWPNALLGNGLIFFIKGLLLMFLYMISIKKAFCCGTVSQQALTFVKKYNDKSLVIRNGLNIVPREISQKITFKKPLHIIMVGNIDHRKYNNLVNIFSSSGKKVNFSIDIYGRIIDSDIEKKLLKLPFVRIKGFCKKIPYTDYDLFLSLSNAENLSIALVEAIASGIPAMGLKVGGTCEVIENGVNGFLISNTSQGLQLLNKKIFNKQINFNNEKCISDFNWKKSAAQYLKLFKKLEKI